MNYAEQNKQTIRVVLLGKEKRTYDVYVFEDLAPLTPSLRYIMCTRCPNWNGAEPEIGQEGFLSYSKVIGGIDKWYNTTDGQHYPYKHTANYFNDFVPVTHVVLGGRVVEREKLIVT